MERFGRRRTVLSPIPTWPVPIAIGAADLASERNGQSIATGPGDQRCAVASAVAADAMGLPYIQMQRRFMPLITADRIFRSRDDLIFNPLVQANPRAFPRPWILYRIRRHAPTRAISSARMSFQRRSSSFLRKWTPMAVDMVDTVTKSDLGL